MNSNIWMWGRESDNNLRPSFDWTDIIEQVISRTMGKQDEFIKIITDSVKTQKQDLRKMVETINRLNSVLTTMNGVTISQMKRLCWKIKMAPMLIWELSQKMKMAPRVGFEPTNIDSQTNTQPFSYTGQMIDLCCEYLSVGCIWLYVVIIFAN